MSENADLKSAVPTEIEAEFAETLRHAACIFEKEKNGRFLGSIVACKAVVRFIHRRGGAAELAGPFLQIAAAFEELERGGKPRLFAKKTIPKKERERSPERKHMQMFAAALLDVLMQLKSKDAGVWNDLLEAEEIFAAYGAAAWRELKQSGIRTLAPPSRH